MRKYQQLLLIFVSFVSVFSLLLYRYEYMKLLNVLEVLNFFGYTADNLTNCILLEDKFYTDLENDNYLAKTPVSWIKHDQHYAYSAFWSTHQQSIYLLLLGPRSAFSGYECRVWFKIADFYTSRPGKFSYNIILNDHDSNFHQFNIRCKPDNIPFDTEPYGILIGKENSLKLFIPIEVQKESHHKDDLIVCIAPDYSGVHDTHLIEFIAYHTLLGVRHFVAYDIGIHYQVLQFLRSIAGHKEMYKTFSTLSWQFPTLDLQMEKSILQKDCIQRTRGHAKHSILLSWDQYLVLNKNYQLNSLNDNVYTFEMKKCCNNRLLKKNWPMAMKKTICEKTNETINLITDEPVIDNPTPTTFGSIHKLEEICEKISGKDDKNMARYLINFVNSKLLILWKLQLKHSINHVTNNMAINL
ncbi:Glycosyltransferase family 92 [Cinara cedri]|uniref:Glycosyltransferase family 92 protein n=1 Tax=Cinara cedri TaxID=506608 RepID=A0A5E4NFF2_9HEMI|nr:Glycosyltransferase family 92 [Cinara cedri]